MCLLSSHLRFFCSGGLWWFLRNFSFGPLHNCGIICFGWGSLFKMCLCAMKQVHFIFSVCLSWTYYDHEMGGYIVIWAIRELEMTSDWMGLDFSAEKIMTEKAIHVFSWKTSCNVRRTGVNEKKLRGFFRSSSPLSPHHHACCYYAEWGKTSSVGRQLLAMLCCCSWWWSSSSLYVREN